MNNKDIKNYFESLYSRIGEARILKRAVNEKVNCQPQAKMCHENVVAWCLHNPDYAPVKGWLYFDAIIKFNAHSVVKAPNGELFDITPSHASIDYPFIESGLSDDDFKELINIFENGEVFYTPKKT